MSTLRSDLLINPQELFDLTISTKGTDLGALATTGDGRYFRYAQAGAVALVPGTLQQAVVEVTGNENLTAVAAAVGATQLVSTSTVTVTANQYQGGWAMITVTPGQGYQYQIGSHAAFTSAAPTFTLTDPIQVALTTGSRIDLVSNPYAGAIINPSTATSLPSGVAIAATPISYYGWLQVRGVANVLADGTVVVGTSVCASNGTAGAVEATAGVQALVGTAVTGIATTEYGAINLTIG
jgi:hypothetical protein